MTTRLTFRKDIADGMYAVLAAYAAANPTKLVRAYRARPSNIAAADIPAAFVDARPERITHDVGTQTRTMTPTVVVVGRNGDLLEVAQANDELVDDLVDALSAVPQFAERTIWDEMTVTDEDFQIGDFVFPGVRFGFGNISIQDGRP